MIYGFNTFGYEGALVSIEADIRNGLPATDIVGLADGAIKEARERIKTAIQMSGIQYPNKRILLSLSPAGLRKDDASFDLPLAVSILEALQLPDYRIKDDILIMGELELSGNIKPVRSTFAACQIALKAGVKYAILPEGSCVPDGMKVCFVKNLNEAYTAIRRRDYKYCKESKAKMSSKIKFADEKFDGFKVSLNDINNDYSTNLKFAMTVAVAGRHNMLVIGTVGRKENKILYKLPQILPELSTAEAQTTTRIHSIAGLMKSNQEYITVRPFRVPHQTATIEGICGGGIHCNPGEISLAHNGVLFLDEASGFRTSVLQMLRVPITTRSITLSRAGRTTVYPADFQLIMSIHPCPCGNYGRKDKVCFCSQKSIEMYWQKFSAPLLDRVEIRFYANVDETLTIEKMTIAKMRELIENAWRMQEKRGEFNGKRKYNENVGYILTDEMVNWFANKKDLKIVQDCISQDYRLNSHRKAHQVLMLARTLADMRCDEKISHSDVELALKLRADTFIEKIIR